MKGRFALTGVVLCAVSGVSLAEGMQGAGADDVICPIHSGTVEATIYDTSLVEQQLDGGWPWEGPIQVVRDHLPPHDGDAEIEPGPPNDLAAGGLEGGPIAAGGGGFDGITQTRWTPPDLTLAVGPNHIVQTVNSTIAFYDKAGNLEFTVPIDDTGNPGFFEDVNAGNFVVDPKCLYDHTSGRFIVIAIEVYSGQSAWFDVAVSDDSNPNGVWFKYRMRAEIPVGSADYWVDYPSFGYDADAVYIGGNLFRLRGNGGSTAGILFRVFDKAPMLVGDPLVFNDLVYGNSFSAQAGHHYGNNPAGFYISVANGTSMRIYGIRDPAGSPTLVMTTVAVPSFTPAQRFSAPNNGGSVDPLDGRVFQVHWRNGALYTGHAISVGGVNKARWYEFDTGNWPDSGTVTLTQSGNVDAGSGIHTYFPALAENGAGDVGMVVAQSASNQFVSVQVTGRKAGDPPGTMGELTQLKIGNRSGSGRWGDYYGIEVDPTDDNTFWIVGQYQNAGGWASWIESFSLASVALPSGFEVTRGELAQGDLEDLFGSDDAKVVVDARRPTEVSVASVEIEVTGMSTSEAPRSFQFVLEASSAGAPAVQRVELYNYDTDSWEIMDERSPSPSDAVVSVLVEADTGRFIDNGTLQMKARIGYHDRGVSFPGWSGNYDVASWRIND
jgi:hypothetical protein